MPPKGWRKKKAMREAAAKAAATTAQGEGHGTPASSEAGAVEAPGGNELWGSDLGSVQGDADLGLGEQQHQQAAGSDGADTPDHAWDAIAASQQFRHGDQSGRHQQQGRKVMDATIESVLLEIRQAQRLEDSAEALKAIAGSLDSLMPEDRAKLLNMPSMSKLLDDAEKKAQDATRPGTAICNDEGRVIANVPWTYEEFVKQFGEVEWTPMEHRWVNFNGVQIEIQKGIPIKTPPQFRDTAMEAWHKEQNLTAEGAAIMSRNFGKDSMILTGDGTEIWRGGR